MPASSPFFKIFNLPPASQLVLYRTELPEGNRPILRLATYHRGCLISTAIQAKESDPVASLAMLNATLQSFDETKARTTLASLSASITKHLPLVATFAEFSDLAGKGDRSPFSARSWSTPAGEKLLLLRYSEAGAVMPFRLLIVRAGPPGALEHTEEFFSALALDATFAHPERASWIKKILLDEKLPSSPAAPPSRHRPVL